MAHQKIQDEIHIVLKTQKIVVHEDVRVNVTVQAQVDPTQDETAFRSDIHSTLRKFINTEWKIQSHQRQRGTGNFESVTVVAMARVPETENYQLNQRATQQSRVGFELLNPTVDYSLSFDEVQKINQDLRLELFKQALEECNFYNIWGGSGCNNFRVADSQFESGSTYQKNTGSTYGVANSFAVMASSFGSGGGNMEADSAADATSGDLNVSTRFEMVGTFTLRAIRT